MRKLLTTQPRTDNSVPGNDLLVHVHFSWRTLKAQVKMPLQVTIEKYILFLSLDSKHRMIFKVDISSNYGSKLHPKNQNVKRFSIQEKINLFV